MILRRPPPRPPVPPEFSRGLHHTDHAEVVINLNVNALIGTDRHGHGSSPDCGVPDASARSKAPSSRRADEADRAVCKSPVTLRSSNVAPCDLKLSTDKLSSSQIDNHPQSIPEPRPASRDYCETYSTDFKSRLALSVAIIRNETNDNHNPRYSDAPSSRWREQAPGPRCGAGSTSDADCGAANTRQSARATDSGAGVAEPRHHHGREHSPVIAKRCSECSGLGWLLVEGRLRCTCDVCWGDGTELIEIEDEEDVA